MNVFITGATGTIGRAVATEFVRRGHTAFGLTRRAAGANLLRELGVEPVVGDLTDPSTYTVPASKADVIVHCGIDYAADAPRLDREATRTLLDVAAGRSHSRVLYTSGVWVFGPTSGKIAGLLHERDPIEEVAWRPDVEDEVLGEQGVVVRPGIVYGGANGPVEQWMSAAEAGRPVTVVGDGSNRWAMIHVEDLARGYAVIAEAGVGGSAYNLTDRNKSTVGEMAQHIIRHYGGQSAIVYQSEADARSEIGSLAEALAMNQELAPSAEAAALGWELRHPSLVLDLDSLATIGTGRIP